MDIRKPDIRARQNVYAFWDWNAFGGKVRQGEHGVRIATGVQTEERLQANDREQRSDEAETAADANTRSRLSRPVTVFHISRTESVSGARSETAISDEGASNSFHADGDHDETHDGTAVYQPPEPDAVAPIRAWAFDHAGRGTGRVDRRARVAAQPFRLRVGGWRRWRRRHGEGRAGGHGTVAACRHAVAADRVATAVDA